MNPPEAQPNGRAHVYTNRRTQTDLRLPEHDGAVLGGSQHAEHPVGAIVSSVGISSPEAAPDSASRLLGVRHDVELVAVP
jgi:hypothetical protein